MQGIPFAVEVFFAGVGILDWFVFGGEITMSVVSFLSAAGVF